MYRQSCGHLKDKFFKYDYIVDQGLQISNYKMNGFWGFNVKHSDYN